MLAQADLSQALGIVAGIIHTISMVLFFAALIIAGLSVTVGRTEYVKHALIGSAIGGLAWLIVNAMFDASGMSPDGIEISL